MLKSITKRLGKGFTLIELMIVVAIIGILAAIAIPNFVKFQCRSKQSEAKTNLKALYVAEESYSGEYDTYVDVTACSSGCTNEMGWQAKGNRIRYSYAATASGGDSFDAQATGFEEAVNADAWQITQENDLTNTSNVCGS